MKLINQNRMPHVLEDDTVLAAAGTPGSTKEVESLSAADRARLVDTGSVLAIDSQKDTAPAATATAPASTAAEPKTTKGGGK